VRISYSRLRPAFAVTVLFLSDSNVVEVSTLESELLRVRFSSQIPVCSVRIVPCGVICPHFSCSKSQKFFKQENQFATPQLMCFSPKTLQSRIGSLYPLSSAGDEAP